MLNFSAHINGKEDPNMLYVHGSVMTYSANAKVLVRRKEPQGINPAILMLDLTIEEDGPMKGTPRHFAYQEEVEGHQFTQVHIIVNNGEDSKIEDVDFLG